MDARAERMGEELAPRWQRMIDAKQLLADCQALVRQLEADLRDELDERSELQAALKREHHEATVAKRTRRSAEEWTAERITQAAVAWVLGCVFVRFLEDNALLETQRLSGTRVRLQRARDEETLYFRQHPERTAREYLEDTFRAIAALPGCSDLFDERHNPLWQLPISGDAARTLLERWREIDPQTGVLVHDFTDPAWGTRFLGDLYQDLSEAARKQYALLQTPEFIEEFILERTLEPAIDEFGLDSVTLIDPACGSGHFLLGAFHRLLGHWREREPGEDHRLHVERVLSRIAGVDLNPFATAIARFRLLIAALRACNVRSLRNAPDFEINVAVGDSLLHAPRRDRLDVGSAGIRKGFEHVYATEDVGDLRRILGEQYHVVVANPPYITPKDAALKQAYRDRFDSCSGKYALSVPFMELLFDLAVPAESQEEPAGFVGQITANSFMKREFGRKLVEEHLAVLDLTFVVDTSGAYIPGHGTPTVILIGRNRPPLAPTIRTVMGLRGEPTAPTDPAHGLVWQAILTQIAHPGSQNSFVAVDDLERAHFSRHPWTLGGGGAGELIEKLRSPSSLGEKANRMGFFGITGFDDLAVAPEHVWRRWGIEQRLTRPVIVGDVVRDWLAVPEDVVFFPYENGELIPAVALEPNLRALWPYRTTLSSRPTFAGTTYTEANRSWYQWHQLPTGTIDYEKLVVMASVATHNHVIIDHGGHAFKQSAPVIDCDDEIDAGEMMSIVGFLNSSTACFMLKQICHDKGGGGIGGGLATEGWEHFFDFTATRVGELPLPMSLPRERSRRLSELAERLESATPGRVEKTWTALEKARAIAVATRARMIAIAEELDWEVYALWGLVDADLTLAGDEIPDLSLGERAFEIVLARRVAAGEEQTTWFERHSSTPITELPKHWPEGYKKMIERRIEVMESNRDIGLIERPEYKRRWQWEPWEQQQERALREWLLDRLEDERYWRQPLLTSCARLADGARRDAEFRSLAEVYTGRADLDLAKLVETLVIDEAVPYLAAWRHTDDGMRIRAAWEETWELQRREDAIDDLCALPEDDPQRLTSEQAKARKQVDVGQIPVPPKYTSKHFRRGAYWQLRGKLDVPKERFILYPGCERAADSSPVIGWAGWNHLERSQALAQYVTRMRQEERWEGERLTPLLAGLAEQLPWVMQWHNEFDPSLGRRVGNAYADFLSGQLAELGLSPEDIAAWRPPETSRGRRARRVAV